LPVAFSFRDALDLLDPINDLYHIVLHIPRPRSLRGTIKIWLIPELIAQNSRVPKILFSSIDFSLWESLIVLPEIESEDELLIRWHVVVEHREEIFVISDTDGFQIPRYKDVRYRLPSA